MTGVFASSAAVGAILGGAGGLTAYLARQFDPEGDAILIRTTIDNNGNPDIIVRLLEIRSFAQMIEIRHIYQDLYPGTNFDHDILNYIPINLRIKALNMLIDNISKFFHLLLMLNFYYILEHLEIIVKWNFKILEMYY